MARHRGPGRSDPALITVVLPVLNVANTIDDQLAALAGQEYAGPWEVIVADNGSEDATLSRVQAWEGRIPGLRWVDASGPRCCAHARNVGIEASRGDWILICDGDDVVSPGWLPAMAKALEKHPLVTGPLDTRTLNQEYQYGGLHDYEYVPDPTLVAYGYLPYASGGNLGMWREVYDKLGGFDTRLPVAEDVDFGWRAFQAGYEARYIPDAVLYYRLRSTTWALVRRRFRGGFHEPLLYRKHARGGMQADALTDVLLTYRSMLRSLPSAFRDRSTRYVLAWRASVRVGRMLGSVRYGTLFL